MSAALQDALKALREGRPVLVLDDQDRENEGDVVLAAQTVTPAWMGWTVRHTSGFVCAPMPADWADRLGLPLMVAENKDPYKTAYAVTVDAATGITTGISAQDRCRTVQLLGSPLTTPGDLVRPGHVVPLRARPGGVLERPGHTEATVDLCRLAGLAPVGAIAELVDDEGEMLRGRQVRALGAWHGLPVITVGDLVTWRLRHDRITWVATTTLPTDYGRFTAHAYRDGFTGHEHVALVGPRGVGDAPPLVRVHSECLTGDAFRSRRCDCGQQLHGAMARLAEEGGIIVYLRGHEGRGVGLADKLRAYAVQDLGADTVEAQERLGLPVDGREYGAASAILRDLRVPTIRLITHNPAKLAALVEGGIEVAGVLASDVATAPEAAGYLRAKRDKLGHTTIPAAAGTTTGRTG